MPWLSDVCLSINYGILFYQFFACLGGLHFYARPRPGEQRWLSCRRSELAPA